MARKMPEGYKPAQSNTNRPRRTTRITKVEKVEKIDPKDDAKVQAEIAVKTEDKNSDQPKIGWWPAWLILGLLAVIFGGMTLDGRGGAVAALLLMFVMLAGWTITVVGMAAALFLALFKGRVGMALLLVVIAGSSFLVTTTMVMPAMKLAAGQ